MPTDARAVLVVDDDQRFADTLAQALGRRGWEVTVAHTLDAALTAARARPMDAAIVDLRLGDEDGLRLIQPLRNIHHKTRIVVLTGFASIATAIKAIKLGADDYLAKPVTASIVVATLLGSKTPTEAVDAPAGERMSPRRLEWEHLHRVLTEHEGNISATARTLRMHRRTLQRKLLKSPPKD